MRILGGRHQDALHRTCRRFWEEIRAWVRRDTGRRTLAVLAVSLAGFVVAWWATSPATIMGINWDTANHLASYASGQWGWQTRPWNSHCGIGQVYVFGSWPVRAAGGTWIDAFRFLHALIVAGAAAVMCWSVLGLTRRLLLSAALTMLFLSSWGIMLLVFTMEDNLLFLPPALGVMSVCLARLDGWRARDSAVCGVLAGLAALMSWQAILYLAPALYAATVLGGRGRTVWQRARDVLLIPACFFLTVFGWALLLAATAPALHLRDLIAMLFARPEASYMPRKNQSWLKPLLDWRASLDHLGVGIAHEIGPAARDSAAVRRAARLIGGVVLGLECLLVGVATVVSWRRRAWRFQLLAVTLLVFTVVTSLYHDPLIDKYKRFDYLPVLTVLLAAWALGEWLRVSRRRWLPAAATALVAAALVTQSSVTLAYNRAWHQHMPPPKGYYGLDEVSWFGYYRDLRRRTPGACSYVFAYSDIAPGRWNHELTAALYSELPDFLVIARPREVVRGWRKPLKRVTPDQARARRAELGCAWFSAAAAKVLDAAPGCQSAAACAETQGR